MRDHSYQISVSSSSTTVCEDNKVNTEEQQDNWNTNNE